MAEITNDKAMAIGTATNWILTLFTALITPLLIKACGVTACYAIFIIPCFLSFIFAVGVMQETKGLNEIEILALYRPDADLIL